MVRPNGSDPRTPEAYQSPGRPPDVLNRERRALNDGVELPDILVGAAEEVDLDLVVRLNDQHLARAGHRKVVFADRNVELLGLRQNLLLDLLCALDGPESRFLGHEVFEVRSRDFDRNDLDQRVTDEHDDGEPDHAPDAPLPALPAPVPHR